MDTASCNDRLCGCQSKCCTEMSKTKQVGGKIPSNLNKMNLIRVKSLSLIGSVSLSLLLLAIVCLAADSPQSSQPISSRAAFLRAQRASRLQQQLQSSSPLPSQQAASSTQAPTSTSKPAASSTSTTTTSTTSTTTTTTTTSTTSKPRPASREQDAQPVRALSAPQTANRTTRTADVEDFNIFVTNTCERELMHVNIKTSKPFFGIIHTRDQRKKAICTTEGTGETEYNLDISHVLNQQDPDYCGVIKARKESPEDKDMLSVVIAVRIHKKIDLTNDKFFLLNCTNRCRHSDCSASPNARLSNPNARIVADETSEGERESVTPPSRSTPGADPAKGEQGDECTIYKFPWVITLLWCLGILLLAMIISHCIMCSSMVCRCVKTEVEEREPSVYEDETEDEDNLYNKKNHPMRIDYDNRDIYKTSNNYEPYNVCNDNRESSKSRHNSSKGTARRYR